MSGLPKFEQFRTRFKSGMDVLLRRLDIKEPAIAITRDSSIIELSRSIENTIQNKAILPLLSALRRQRQYQLVGDLLDADIGDVKKIFAGAASIHEKLGKFDINLLGDYLDFCGLPPHWDLYREELKGLLSGRNYAMYRPRSEEVGRLKLESTLGELIDVINSVYNGGTLFTLGKNGEIGETPSFPESAFLLRQLREVGCATVKDVLNLPLGKMAAFNLPEETKQLFIKVVRAFDQTLSSQRSQAYDRGR